MPSYLYEDANCGWGLQWTTVKKSLWILLYFLALLFFLTFIYCNPDLPRKSFL